MNRRLFLKRSTLAPVALVAAAVGLQTSASKPIPALSLNLGEQLPVDGRWYTVTAETRAMRQSEQTFYLDFLAVTRERVGDARP